MSMQSISGDSKVSGSSYCKLTPPHISARLGKYWDPFRGPKASLAYWCSSSSGRSPAPIFNGTVLGVAEPDVWGP